jgi:ATP-dependent Clp protease ATP-binding subunit ClpA
MFERFTMAARAVLSTAQEEARQLHHNFIGTEHLALGVVGSGDAAVSQLLAGYDFTIEDMRTRVVETIGVVTEPGPGGPPPFTPRAKKVLELSLREALAMGHNEIQPAHILLGILREANGVGAVILGDYGVDYDRTRLWVAQLMGEFEPRRRGRGRGRARGLRVGFEPEFARRRPSHLRLLSLFDDPESMAAKVLDSFGATREKVEAKVAEIGLENTSDAPPKPPVPPRTVRLAEGVEIRITDDQLVEMVDTGKLEELLKEVIRRAKPSN